MAQSLLLRRAKAIFHHQQAPGSPLRGRGLAHLPVLESAYILIENGRIAAYGPDSDAPERADRVMDVQGRCVLPSWCDSHTHLVYAASRESEFTDRIKGLTYEQIAQRGGGILNSARKLQETPEEALYEQAYARLQEVIRFGTGAIEIKSGYGLTVESELKMLRVVRRLKEHSPIPIRATFLGAHAIPASYQSNRAGYVDLIIQEMLPRIHDEGLADYIDVFCDRGFFTPNETEQLLTAGVKYGLKAKIHVNELANSGGVQVGVRQQALSVDHLERIGDEEISLLAKSKTIGTLLPSCAFFLNIPYAPGRTLVDAGAAIALATDYNPGS
ncbi:MAG: imidazolonepropionase, partial [Saprospiraceae bacterium]|nr:imidazolonepropionase [Saprospiraceae bacterium]